MLCEAHGQNMIHSMGSNMVVANHLGLYYNPQFRSIDPSLGCTEITLKRPSRTRCELSQINVEI
jgi:hypothetical protein